MPIKFFQKDIISGQATKVGDKFTVHFMGADKEFEVSEFHGDMFFAEMDLF